VSGRVEFVWYASDEQFPRPFQNNFSGDLHWSVELTRANFTAAATWVDEVFPDPDDPYDLVWHNKLAFYEVPNGDSLASDLAQDTYGQVVYLSRDDGAGDGHVMATDFDDLLSRWVPLGCPGGEDWQWQPFTHHLTTMIDPSIDIAPIWQGLLGIPISA
jgi:hypothetical protein